MITTPRSLIYFLLWRFPRLCFWPSTLRHVETPLVLVSSFSINHHHYADDTQLFFCFHPLMHLTFKALFNRSFETWMAANLLTLITSLRLNSCSSSWDASSRNTQFTQLAQWSETRTDEMVSTNVSSSCNYCACATCCVIELHAFFCKVVQFLKFLVVIFVAS